VPTVNNGARRLRRGMGLVDLGIKEQLISMVILTFLILASPHRDLEKPRR